MPDAASAPVISAAPFPWFTGWLISRRRGSSMFARISAVPSSEPSSTTISSFRKGISVASTSVTARSIVSSSLNAGMTIDRAKCSEAIGGFLSH